MFQEKWVIKITRGQTQDGLKCVTRDCGTRNPARVCGCIIM